MKKLIFALIFSSVCLLGTSFVRPQDQQPQQGGTEEETTTTMTEEESIDMTDVKAE